jgi:hypothetical protein
MVSAGCVVETGGEVLVVDVDIELIIGIVEGVEVVLVIVSLGELQAVMKSVAKITNNNPVVITTFTEICLMRSLVTQDHATYAPICIFLLLFSLFI